MRLWSSALGARQKGPARSAASLTAEGCRGGRPEAWGKGPNPSYCEDRASISFLGHSNATFANFSRIWHYVKPVLVNGTLAATGESRSEDGHARLYSSWLGDATQPLISLSVQYVPDVI